MRTARSLTVSPYVVVSHACPPGATMHAPQSNHACPPRATTHAPPEQPCTPPRATTHAPPEQPCMPPWEQPRMPALSNHAHPPGATTHAPPEQPCMPPQSNHTSPPQSNHTPPRSNHACPPRSNHTRPPGATPHAPLDRIVDTRFWKYYLAPTSLRAVNMHHLDWTATSVLCEKSTERNDHMEKETYSIDALAHCLYNGKFDNLRLFLYLNPSRSFSISQMEGCLPSFLWPLFQIKTMKKRNVDQRMETSRVIFVDLLINSWPEFNFAGPRWRQLKSY